METTIVIQVVRGVVTHIAQVSNVNHPAIPTIENLRKLFGPKDAHHAEEALADWPCFDALTVQELQGKRVAEPAPKGNTYGEYLYDHARKVLGQ